MADGSSTPSKHEQMLSSFVSLLSSGRTSSGETGHPLCANAALSCAFSSPPPPSAPGSPSAVRLSLPSLDLKNKAVTLSVTRGMNPMESAAFNLAVPILAGDDDLAGVPSRVLRNVSDSFATLVESRLRSSLAALLRQTLACSRTQRSALGISRSQRLAGAQSRVLMGLLSRPDPVEITAAVTLLRTVPAAGDKQERRDDDRGDNGAPLVFEAVLDVSVLGHATTAVLRTVGTAKGRWDSSVGDDGDGRLQSGEITFDTISLLQDMIKQARIVVKASLVASSSTLASMGSAPPLSSAQSSSERAMAAAADGIAIARDAKGRSVRFVKTVPVKTVPVADDCSSCDSRSTCSTCSSGSGWSSGDGSRTSGSGSVRAGSEGETGSQSEGSATIMPPPPPRSPLHSSRSTPRLLYYAGRRTSAEALAEGHIPPGSRTSERSDGRRQTGPCAADGDHDTESVPSFGLNESWDSPAGSRNGSRSGASSAATSLGFALLGKRGLSSNGGEQAEECDARDCKRHKKNVPFRKRRISSCPEMA